MCQPFHLRFVDLFFNFVPFLIFKTKVSSLLQNIILVLQKNGSEKHAIGIMPKYEIGLWVYGPPGRVVNPAGCT